MKGCQSLASNPTADVDLGDLTEHLIAVVTRLKEEADSFSFSPEKVYITPKPLYSDVKQ